MLTGKNVSKWWYLLLVASCLHLFFINVKDSHDWGDDFAQYIHQAENISKGILQTETGYIYNKDYALYSPPLYFTGFPLVLAPVYAIAGNNMLAFSYLISAFLFFSALIFFRFFISYFKPVTSCLLVLIIVCNPWMLDYKMEIGSDIPFTFFLFLSILFYLNSKKSVRAFILLGMLAGFLISIRSIGVAFALAVVVNELLKIKQETASNKKKQTGLLIIIFLVVCAAFFVLLNNVIFNIPLLNLQSSASLFTFNDLYKTILKNCNYYFDIFQTLFSTPPENIYALFSTLIKSSALSLLLLGFYLRIKRGMEFIDFLFIFYMLVLYVYPYSASGYRFLIPVTPILLLLVAEGLYFLMTAFQWKKNILYGLCIISFYTVYKYDWEIILGKQNYILQG
ncbi:MAG: glycosyltransferase family 39 protein, partial [Bacteroidia bacterium]